MKVLSTNMKQLMILIIIINLCIYIHLLLRGRKDDSQYCFIKSWKVFMWLPNIFRGTCFWTEIKSINEDIEWYRYQNDLFQQTIHLIIKKSLKFRVLKIWIHQQFQTEVKTQNMIKSIHQKVSDAKFLFFQILASPMQSFCR